MKEIFKYSSYRFPKGSRWYSIRFWDPLLGCTPVSEGCRICSSARTVGRRKIDTEIITQTIDGIDHFNGIVKLNEKAFDEVAHFKTNEQIFVAGRSDLYHEDVPDWYLEKIINCANIRPDCTFVALTKRPQRIGKRSFPKNFWISVTIENQKTAEERLLYLKDITGTKMVSAKPLLGAVDLLPFMALFDMVATGGEHGSTSRPTHPDWIRSLRDQCIAAKKPFSFHNWGLWHPGPGRVTRYVNYAGEFTNSEEGTPVHIHEQCERGNDIDGVVWDQYPPCEPSNQPAKPCL